MTSMSSRFALSFLAASTLTAASCASSTTQSSAPAATAAKPSDTGTIEPAAKADPWAGRELFAPPKPSPAGDLDLGTISIEKLPNGLTLVLVPRHELPLVETVLTVPAGLMDDPEGREGMSILLEATLRRGTKTRTADQVSDTIEQLGGRIDSSSGFESTTLSCSVLSKDARTCLELVADIGKNATFPEEELKLARDQIVGALVKRTFDQPRMLAGEHIMNMLYGDGHPHGRVITEASLAAVDRKSIVDFYRKHFVADGTILSVAGDFDMDATKRELGKLFGSMAKGSAPRRSALKVEAPQGLRVLLVDKPGLNQVQIGIAHPGISLSDPDHPAVVLMNEILGGGGFSSRLMKVIRSEKGRTYGISSEFELLGVQGSFTVNTFTRSDGAVATLKDVLAEIARYRAEGPTEEEVSRLKGSLVGSYPLGVQRPVEVVGRVVNALLHGYDVEYVRTYARKLDALTRADVAKAAAEHLDAENVAVVMVGDGQELEPMLKEANLAYERILWNEPISRKERLAAKEKGSKAGAAASTPAP